MKAVFLDIDNTLLSFDGYVKQTMKEGFEHFGLKPYEPYMFDIFIRENTKLWRQIEQGTLVFEELEKIRWNIIFKYLDIEFDGTVFEKYFRGRLFDSAIPEEETVVAVIAVGVAAEDPKRPRRKELDEIVKVY